MSKHKLIFLALFWVLLAGNANAEDKEREAVLALIDTAFDFVDSGSLDDWRSIQLAEGTTINFRPHPSGTPGELLMRMTSNEIEAASLDEDTGAHEYTEGWTGEPTVMIRGPIAVVWGDYDFWIDGEFSHCGIDSVDLVKFEGDWKIANWMWTVEKDNCPTDPAR